MNSRKDAGYSTCLKIFQKFYFMAPVSLLKYGSCCTALEKGGLCILIMKMVAPIEKMSAFSPLYFGCSANRRNFDSISGL